MKDLIEEWKSKKDGAKINTKKKILSLANQKAKEINNKANQVHDEVFNQLDCLDCANCCKSIPPLLNDTDAKRIAKFLGIKLSRFKEEYITIDDDGDTVLNTVPCIFLEGDNKCKIYEVRPKACREYPHTDNNQFMRNIKLHMENISYCPAVYHIIQKLTDPSC